jgi:hypothetical protein
MRVNNQTDDHGTSSPRSDLGLELIQPVDAGLCDLSAVGSIDFVPSSQTHM